jgi:hypothetical protein
MLKFYCCSAWGFIDNFRNWWEGNRIVMKYRSFLQVCSRNKVEVIVG